MYCHHTPLLRAPALLVLSLFLLLLGASRSDASPNTVFSRPFNQLGTGDGASFVPSWDQNGRFAVFLSKASNLVVGQNTPAGSNQIFLFDRIAGTTKLVSHIPGNPTVGGNGELEVGVRISRDGNWVLFGSAATNLVAGQVDGNNDVDVFLWNRLTDTTLLVSRAAGSTSTTGDGRSSVFQTRLSNDARFVLFTSFASNLVAAQIGNAFQQGFLFDRISGQTLMVSHAFNLAARSANGDFLRGSLSGDGRWVAFESNSTNSIDGLTDNNATTDVFLWDRDADFSVSLQLLSRKEGFPATTSNQGGNSVTISTDGTGITFASASTDAEGVSSDTNGQADAFHYDRPTGTFSLMSHRHNNTTITGDAGVVGVFPLSDDGDSVAFESSATNHVLLQVDTNNNGDIFLWRAGGLTLASHVSASVRETGNARSALPALAGDGRSVAFVSLATNLVAGITDVNAALDIFAYRRSTQFVELISHIPDGTQTCNLGVVFAPGLAVGVGVELIGFTSPSDNLDIDDDNGEQDVFFHTDLLMADSFESGDLSAWSLHVP